MFSSSVLENILRDAPCTPALPPVKGANLCISPPLSAEDIGSADIISAAC